MGLFSKRFGETPIPGEATVALPAGKVKINYEENRQGRELDDWPGMPDGLEVTLMPAGGGSALEITRPRMHNEFAGGGRIGERYGQVELAAAGDYVVKVPAVESERTPFEPRISFKS
jgi:hypothetical protein